MTIYLDVTIDNRIEDKMRFEGEFAAPQAFIMLEQMIKRSKVTNFTLTTETPRNKADYDLMEM